MPDNKYGNLFANHALYEYLLTHSYRPNVHLDELHQVRRICKPFRDVYENIA